MPKAEDTSEEASTASLAQDFRTVLKVWDELDTTSLSQISPEYQKKVNDVIEKLEEMTRKVNALGLFSSNEEIEEVATDNLRFMLLPAFLADFSLRTQKYDRIEMIEHATVYYKDFIKRLNEYGVCNYRFEDDEEEGSSNKPNTSRSDGVARTLIEAAAFRKNKIERYSTMKKIEEEMKQLKSQVLPAEESGVSIDDEILRKFFLSLISVWINRAIDDLAFIKMEKPILETRARVMAQQIPEPKSRKPVPRPPITITKNELQKRVFGAGYPSLPTVTVDEFIQGKLDDGTLSFQAQKQVYDNSLYNWANDPEAKKQQDITEEEENERKVEQDDPEHLARMRRMDDWKDEHRRGEGNRHNMG